MNGPPSSLPAVTYQGPVSKKSSSLFVGWRPRYAAISGNTLVLYRTETVSKIYRIFYFKYVM